jgi:hypothetical protein
MTMVSRIGGASLAQALVARPESRKTQDSAAAATTVSVDDTETSAPGVRSEQAAATARVGGQLDAQFDAGRVQRAQEEAEAGATAATGTDEAEASPTAAPAAGGAHASGGAAGSASASTDYIAKADTNKDRKVSEQERIAYARKQASEAEKASSTPDTPAQQSRALEVQQAYLPQETTGVQLDIEA